MMSDRPWIDKIMKPFSCDPHWLPAHMYNRIHEAVGRGTEQEGIDLVKTIVHALEAAGQGTSGREMREAYNRGFTHALSLVSLAVQEMKP